MDASVIDTVKERVNLADVVGRYVQLRHVSGRWMGPCPFHQETKPSFSVNAEEGFYYCFGCQATGDVIDFYRQMNGLEFREALEALAEEAGVDLGASKADPEAVRRRKLRKVCLEMHEVAAKHFRSVLRQPRSETARTYISRRGLSDEVIEAFGLGYAPDEWQNLSDALGRKGYGQDLGVTAGLLSKNDRGRIYDRFRGRLIFPIQDLAGRVLAFGGRVIDDGEPKYLNSSESPIYTKGEHLYGLYQARPVITRSRRVLLTEGYLDVITLHQYGYGDAAGVLGTALTSSQVRRMGSMAKGVDLVFDGDAAGRKAALRSAEMVLSQGLKCRVVILPEGEDVDSLLHARGREGFEACLAEARDGLDFAMEEMRENAAPREIMEWVEKFLGNLKVAGWRAYFLPRLARGLGLDERELAGSRGNAPQRSPQPEQRAGAIPETGHKRDRELLAFAIRCPQYRELLGDSGFDRALATDWARSMWRKVVGNPDDSVFGRLNDDERALWARARSEGEMDPELAQRYFDDICQFVRSSCTTGDRADLKQALRQAEMRGDHEEAARIVRQIEASFGS